MAGLGTVFQMSKLACQPSPLHGRGLFVTKSVRAGEVLDLAVEHGIIQKSGSWFSYEGTKLGHGRDSVKDLIEANA
jgi:hypothetical protein